VTDDGKGFDVESASAGSTFGLVGMRERVLAAAGEIVVESSPVGTRVRIVLPSQGPPLQASGSLPGNDGPGTT
jgi:signal transduction histidine kinase